jgi:peptide/nickel transport system substrate-binding protein
VICERNPYYWKVDPEGNQLPYLDAVHFDVVENAELLNLKALAGEVDMQLRNILWTNYPLFIENAEQGDYRVLKWILADGSNCTFTCNMNHQNPGMREIMENRDFRIALSHGLNRNDINELAYQGMGIPRQMSLVPQSPYFKPEHAEKFAEFDPDKANKILDSIGMTERDSEGYRMRLDGEPLTITLEYVLIFGPFRDAVQMASDMWKELGIRVVPKEEDRSLIAQRTAANEHDMVAWMANLSYITFTYPVRYMPHGDSGYVAVSGSYWWQWYLTGGKEGEEPPPEVKRQYELYDLIKGARPEELPALAEEFFDNASEQIWFIGTVGVLPAIVIVKNDFRNVPEVAIEEWPLLTPGYTSVEQYFWRQG